MISIDTEKTWYFIQGLTSLMGDAVYRFIAYSILQLPDSSVAHNLVNVNQLMMYAIDGQPAQHSNQGMVQLHISIDSVNRSPPDSYIA